MVWLFYCNDNDDVVIHYQNGWPYKFADELKKISGKMPRGEQGVGICPSNKGGGATHHAYGVTYYNYDNIKFSYALNNSLRKKKLSRLKSNRVILGETYKWNGIAPYPLNITVQNFTDNIPIERHGNGINYGFSDDHGETWNVATAIHNNRHSYHNQNSFYWNGRGSAY